MKIDKDKILKQVKRYQNTLNQLIKKFIAESNEEVKQNQIKVEIIFCTNGVLIRKTINSHIPNIINTYESDDTVENVGKQLKMPAETFIADNKQIFTSNIYNRKTIKKYNGKSTAEEHFKIIVENNYLIDVKKIKCIDDALHFHNIDDFPKGTFIYRGQVNENWELKPSLFRKYPSNANEIESPIFENLIRGEQSFFQKTFDPLEHLINCQHFNVPTRLLDLTSDFLIALFFACYDEKDENKDEDGALYCLLKEQYSTLLINDSKFKELKKPLNNHNIHVFKERLQTNEIKFIEPIIKNPRLRVQDGCFLLFPFQPLSSQDNKYVDLLSYISAKNEYLKKENIKNEPFFIGVVKVDKISKKSILKELENNYGISKESLYVNKNIVNQTEEYYINLYEKAKKKRKELFYKENKE